MTFSPTNPAIRIGMIRSTPQAEFICNADCTFQDGTGRAIGSVKAGTACRVMVEACTKAELQYFLRVAICDSEKESRAQMSRSAYLQTGLRYERIGLVINLSHHTVDNREYWVLAGPFAHESDAAHFKLFHDLPNDSTIVPRIITPPSANLVCNDMRFQDRLRVIPSPGESAAISLADVAVGIEFHWQHRETQLISGILEVAINNRGELTAVDETAVEDYLASVNSSEMTADCHLELLKAQTVAARSTIFATMGKHHAAEPFHLCADDHCQCYHGAGAVLPQSERATRETCGEVLLYGNQVCDARYSKICGGVVEDYKNVWDSRTIPYLVPFIDGLEKIDMPIDSEQKAEALITSNPDVYCNTTKYSIPASLGDSHKLFRWKIEYKREELQELISQKLNYDFGELIDILPGARGASGRLIEMTIVGSKKTLRIGKELEIRRVLSKSHLYSACFVIERRMDSSGAVGKFIFHGAGWGHGVGLCQVGATVMANLGFDYTQIVAHYYKHTKLKALY